MISRERGAVAFRYVKGACEKERKKKKEKKNSHIPDWMRKGKEK